MLYFAYGSNMLTERLQDRVPSAEPVTTAHLPGRTLRFHKRSQDGSGKCNLIDALEESVAVHGVLFQFATDDFSALDEAEHRGYGYKRCRVHPQTADGSVEAFAYVAQPAYVDDALLPYDWYQALVTAVVSGPRDSWGAPACPSCGVSAASRNRPDLPGPGPGPSHPVPVAPAHGRVSAPLA